jgi:aerobic-type carbon monoxide dehydrogenase small subunit (CoxS/CutS family)
VVVDGVARRSCLTFTPQVDGCEVETIESVAGVSSLDPLQQAIHDHHGVQCGFCTPGIVMALVAARRSGVLVEAAVEEVLNGHLCRCTGYVNLRAAVVAAWPTIEAAAVDRLLGPDS